MSARCLTTLWPKLEKELKNFHQMSRNTITSIPNLISLKRPNILLSKTASQWDSKILKTITWLARSRDRVVWWQIAPKAHLKTITAHNILNLWNKVRKDVFHMFDCKLVVQFQFNFKLFSVVFGKSELFILFIRWDWQKNVAINLNIVVLTYLDLCLDYI